MKRKHQGYREDLIGYLFILPVFLGVAFFIFYPFGYSFISTFKNWSGLRSLADSRWVNFEMYKRVLSDNLFWKAFGNTLITLIGVPIGLAISIFLALLLNRGLKGTQVYRVIFYIPVVSSLTAIIILWRGMLAVEGPLNDVLAVFRIKAINWLGEPTYARIGLIGMCVWKGLGVSILFYIAGLQGISESYKEAARIDGANDWQIFWKITLPLLRPTTFFMIVTGIINGMQLYVEPDLLLNGGPGNATTTLVLYLFNRFEARRISEASVVAWILALFIFIVTTIQFVYNNRREKA
ncbi:MAG: sugar ABC transporter permease [Acholeplasmataceae bacterium]|nr:sugar ABC transporter permease [Acholeplasmataceae bacterium]